MKRTPLLFEFELLAFLGNAKDESTQVRNRKALNHVLVHEHLSDDISFLIVGNLIGILTDSL